MLSDTVIVQSAVSAFNNAALWAPAFLWWAILAMPLFVLTYMCSETILARLKWTKENLLGRACVWTAGLVFVWVVLFGGNYSVLRDGLSVLPMMTAVIVFLTSLFVSSHVRWRALPRFGWRGALGCGLIILCVGVSDTHAWWGPLLQIGAMLVGGVLGRYARGEMRPVAGTVLIMAMVVIAILVQPEFFRFGQLGNLTLLHLLTILLFGICVAMTVVLFNVKACGAIRHSVYIKVKWLMRVVCALGAALFLLTEAVPVFLGTLLMFALLVALSVWHSESMESSLGQRVFSCALVLFGVITVMPVISALGILCWKNVMCGDFKAKIRRLL